MAGNEIREQLIRAKAENKEVFIYPERSMTDQFGHTMILRGDVISVSETLVTLRLICENDFQPEWRCWEFYIPIEKIISIGIETGSLTDKTLHHDIPEDIDDEDKTPTPTT